MTNRHSTPAARPAEKRAAAVAVLNSHEMTTRLRRLAAEFGVPAFPARLDRCERMADRGASA